MSGVEIERVDLVKYRVGDKHGEILFDSEAEARAWLIGQERLRVARLLYCVLYDVCKDSDAIRRVNEDTLLILLEHWGSVNGVLSECGYSLGDGSGG
jgi:hypothetical protein